MRMIERGSRVAVARRRIFPTLPAVIVVGVGVDGRIRTFYSTVRTRLEYLSWEND